MTKTQTADLNSSVVFLVEMVGTYHQTMFGADLCPVSAALFPKKSVLEKQTRKCLLYLVKYIFNL